MASFRRLVAAFGFTAIEVSHSTDAAGLEVLRGDGDIPLSSLHAPTPRRRLADGRFNGDSNLASTDPDERRLALEETKRTIEIAAAAKLDRVVLHLGGVGNFMSEPERRLRRLYESGAHEGEAVEQARDELRRFRAEGIDAHLEAARDSLRELVELAAPKGDEALYLLSDYDDAVAGYWHDVGHCEVQARLGLIDRAAWFPKLTARTIGSHLHDVDGILDHRSPGNGDVDWSYIAAGLPPTALRVFEIDQRQSEASVAASIAYLQELGVVQGSVSPRTGEDSRPGPRR